MSKKRKALGKGLSALISEDLNKADDNNIVEIDLNLIEPNPNQPRKTFDNEKIQELADSIKEHGLIQPVIVKKVEDNYQLIAGERRWRACIELGMDKISAIVRDLDNKSQTEIALIENIQREDLNPIDEGVAYELLIERYDLTQEELSQIVGKSRVYVTNILRLLKLSDRVKEKIKTGEISQGHGKILVGLSENRQYQLLNRIVKEKLSVRELEKIVKNLKNEPAKSKKIPVKEPYILNLEEELQSALNTDIKIKNKGKKKKIEIFFSDDDQLENIYKILINNPNK
ncbi:MAG TPA: chromosome partitioning protein ParB [Clostridiales bacterium]|jgi:ParB family chromosome partitioning protein|nr:chromosome partitioning protein ParB [Clostridiales bacterium]